MKRCNIPAQVTTVDDKIIGNLSVTQLLLLASGLFVSTFLYIILPPFTHNSFYKILLISLTILSCIILSWKIKDKILLQWLIIILTYILRPNIYVNSCFYIEKESSFVNPHHLIKKQSLINNESFKLMEAQNINQSKNDLYFGNNLIESQEHNLFFCLSKKGELNVKIINED